MLSILQITRKSSCLATTSIDTDLPDVQTLLFRCLATYYNQLLLWTCLDVLDLVEEEFHHKLFSKLGI